MLSQGEKLKEMKRMRELPELAQPRTVRLKFRKVGSLQFISHLDLQRTFMRVLTRACIPVWYTKGFNPHAKLVFSTPLSVGTQSEYEFLDIRIDREMSPEEIMNRLNRELTEELCVTEAYLPKRDFSEIAWATYEIEICTEGASAELAEGMMRTLTSSPVLLTKKTKAGEKEIDIVPMIHEIGIRFDEEKGIIRISAVLSATTGEFLNPEMLITALRREHGILSGDLMSEWYTILRTSVMKADFTKFQ